MKSTFEQMKHSEYFQLGATMELISPSIDFADRRNLRLISSKRALPFKYRIWD